MKLRKNWKWMIASALILLVFGSILYQLFTAIPEARFRQIAFLQGNDIGNIDWRPEGNILAIGGVGVSLYNFLSNRESHISEPNMATHLAWDSSGIQLVTIGDEVWVWNSGTGARALVEYKRYRIFSDVEWYQDNSRIVVASFGLNPEDNGFWIWDTEQFDLVMNIRGDGLQNLVGDNGFADVHIVPQSDLLIGTSIGTNATRIWDATTGSPAVAFLGVSLSDGDLAPSPDGLVIANSDLNGSDIIFWDRVNGSELYRLTSTQIHIDILSWNRLGNMLISASREEGTAVIWDMNSRQVLTTLDIQPTETYNIEWHPVRDYVAIATGYGTRIWNIFTGESQLVQSGFTHIARWSPDGNHLAVVGRDGLSIYDIFAESN